MSSAPPTPGRPTLAPRGFAASCVLAVAALVATFFGFTIGPVEAAVARVVAEHAAPAASNDSYWPPSEQRLAMGEIAWPEVPTSPRYAPREAEVRSVSDDSPEKAKLPSRASATPPVLRHDAAPRPDGALPYSLAGRALPLASSLSALERIGCGGAQPRFIERAGCASRSFEFRRANPPRGPPGPLGA